MARTTAQALDSLRALLVHPESGVNAQMAAIEARDGVIVARVPDEQVLLLNLPPDLADENLEINYPAVLLFAEEAENLNRQRFAYFSGTLRLGVDVRLSADSPETLEANLHRYVEAITNVLAASRGEWSPGLVYAGRFTARFAPARLGGVNFLQSARLAILLDMTV
jgi:hypothetical protein